MSTPSPTTESPPDAGRIRKHVHVDADVLLALVEDGRVNSRSLSGSINYHLRRALGMAA